jgi:DNA-binding NtrC family response regulator
MTPEELLEAKLFGQLDESGGRLPGVFEQANGGTVFLEEIGELPAQLQVKLMQFLDRHEVQPVGCVEGKRVNTRLLAASCQALRPLVVQGRFREDLYYRLAFLEIQLPSLLERLEDIPLLVQVFLRKYNQEYGRKIQGLTRRAQVVLLQHGWPGNIRELENVIAGAALLADGNFIDLDDLPGELTKHRGALQHGRDLWRPVPLDEVKRTHIQRVLQLCEGNRVRAAQILGIGRTSLYRHLKRNGSDQKKAFMTG